MAIQSNLRITIQMLDWRVYAFEATVKHYYAYLNLIFMWPDKRPRSDGNSSPSYADGRNVRCRERNGVVQQLRLPRRGYLASRRARGTAQGAQSAGQPQRVQLPAPGQLQGPGNINNTVGTVCNEDITYHREP